MRTWIPLVVVAAALGLAGLPMVPHGSGGQTVVAPATGAPEGGGSEVQKQFEQAFAFRRNLKPDGALEVYRKLLDNPSLSPLDHAKAFFLVAQTYEVMPERGEMARHTYRHVRDLYPDDPLACYAAKHLGAAFTSATLMDGKRDFTKAAEQDGAAVAYIKKAGVGEGPLIGKALMADDSEY
jgi:hypothetical protein